MVSDGLIESVGRYQPTTHGSGNLVDLGNAAIIPGLVNSHTHLEFSYLPEPLGEPGIPFTDWIRKIVKSRSDANQQPSEKVTVIQQGLLESFRAGVWCVGDIATSPVTVAQYRQNDAAESASRTTAVVFLEQLGRNPALFSEKLEQLNSFLDSAAGSQLIAAVSPHAPYSVSPQLMALLCERATSSNLPVAMHLAETEAERELLEKQTGPFVDLLKEFGAWDSSTFLPPGSILDYLKTLARASRALVIHGNYLNDEEIEYIASVGRRMSVVYCPRTHRFFGHRPIRSNGCWRQTSASPLVLIRGRPIQIWICFRNLS